jgi:hypothetical protein
MEISIGHYSQILKTEMKGKLDQYVFLKMDLCTKENGSSTLTPATEEEYKFSLTEADTMAFGKMICSVEKGDLCMQKVTSTKEIG